jgi:hypothetical protein
MRVTSQTATSGYKEVTKMQDYYSIYTWAMDKQAQMERQAAERRLLRQSPLVSLRLSWPIRRRDGR